MYTLQNWAILLFKLAITAISLQREKKYLAMNVLSTWSQCDDTARDRLQDDIHQMSKRLSLALPQDKIQLPVTIFTRL